MRGGGIFDPFTEGSQDPGEIDRVMSEAKFTRLLTDVKKFWAFDARKLAKEYDGDARNIFSGVSSFDEIAERIQFVPKTGRGFMGFQKKMVSMIIYFLRERKLIDLNDFPPPVPPPVDFHLMRIMINTQVVVLDDDDDPDDFRYEKSSPFGYEAIEAYLVRTGVDPVVLGDALWLLSGNLCQRSPRNKMPGKFGTLDKDLIARTSLAKAKELRRHPGLFGDGDLPHHINPSSLGIRTTCGRCPARGYCKSGMPATEYYIRGKFRRINVEK
jgi:hypothetical protein